VTRGPISQVVTATGTLAAQDTVLVGSQVSGTISEIYVDYNSKVHRGQVLARLDPGLFAAALEQAKGTLG
jgi:HlyD family secretion protein